MKVGCSCVLFLAVSAYAQLLTSFTRNVFLETWAVNKKIPNIIVSPYSLVAPLGTLALASEGTSQKQILRALGVQTTSQVSAIHAVCKQQISNMKDVVINTYNRLYISNREELLPEFNDAAQHIYDVDIKSVDFSTPKEVAKEINKWVKMKTENRIQNLIHPSALDSTTRAVLVNTIYFDGRWMKKFDDSVERYFYAYDSTMIVQTMKVEMMLKYGYDEKLEAEVVSIPYKRDKCSFVVVLPKNTTKINHLMIKLKRNSDAVNNALNKLKKRYIQLWMPVFEFETETDVKIVLKKLNIKDIFSSKAKLTTMTKSGSELFIQSAIQKTYINVNEQGTQAAAANAFRISLLAAYISTAKQVAVDRPFYFEIRCSAVTLFNGILRKP